MGKKQKAASAEENHRARSTKNNKIKNKQMFAQLKTHQENKISKFNRNNSAQMAISQEIINEDSENGIEGNIDISMTKDSQDIEQLCSLVHTLIEKKKLSAKNAFEVPFIDLEKLGDFQNISQSDNGWKRISSTLENDSKIYSYRVDAIHSIAYKIMNTMNRNQDEPVNQQKPKEDMLQHPIDKVAIPIVDEFDISLGAQLEKNVENINLQSLSKFSEFNPTYERTRRRFDQNGLRGMLLNNIQIDSNYELSLNETRKLKSSGFYMKAMPVEVGKLAEQPQIFKSIEIARKDVFNIVKEQFNFASGYQQSWRKVKNGELSCEKEDQMDIQMDQERIETTVFRKVEDVVKLKPKTKQSLKSTNDVVQDGLSWLSDMDKKMLGLSTTSGPTIKKTTSTKSQRNEDDIDFITSKEILRRDVFSDDTMQRQKQEYNEQIQQKHLLPIRLFHKFKVEQIMTLREEPPENFVHNDMEIEGEIAHQKQIQQVDIKRQQISIRQSKQKLKSMVLKQTDFKALCKKFEIAERNIAPELCFLTVLHLANQNNLRLEQVDDYNFLIKY